VPTGFEVPVDGSGDVRQGAKGSSAPRLLRRRRHALTDSSVRGARRVALASASILVIFGACSRTGLLDAAGDGVGGTTGGFGGWGGEVGPHAGGIGGAGASDGGASAGGKGGNGAGAWGGADAGDDADSGCSQGSCCCPDPKPECQWNCDPWADCLWNCFYSYDDAFAVMQWKLLACACQNLCSSYCMPGPVNACTSPHEWLWECLLCESIVLMYDECPGAHKFLCHSASCKSYVECLAKCPEPPPHAPFPKGGSLRPDAGNGECCPELPPSDGQPCDLGSLGGPVCVYGTKQCVCQAAKQWSCTVSGP
jgi:hypothetical protein